MRWARRVWGIGSVPGRCSTEACPAGRATYGNASLGLRAGPHVGHQARTIGQMAAVRPHVAYERFVMRRVLPRWRQGRAWAILLPIQYWPTAARAVKTQN